MGYSLQRVLTAFVATLKSIFTDKGVVLLLVVAPIIYGFFYPWPYSQQAVKRVPVVIVDLDHSSLSQQIIRFAQASPRLDIRQMPDERLAKEAMWRQDIGGYMVIPSGLKRDVLMQRPATVAVAANGGYLMLNKEVLTGFAEVVGTVSAGVQIKRLSAQGMSQDAAYAAQNPVPLIMQAQYNPTEGYGSYVVPGVAVLILHQTLLIGSALLIGTWREQRRQRVPITIWLGRIGALSCVGWLAGLYYFGWVFMWQGYAHGANMGAALLLLLVFAPTVATLGCLLGQWFSQRERPMQFWLVSSLPLFFVSGYAWPDNMLPWPLQILRWLVPSTPAIQASVRFNQIGTPLADGAYLLWVLLAQGLVYLLLLYWLGAPKRTR